jgi:hypothetical protein
VNAPTDCRAEAMTIAFKTPNVRRGSGACIRERFKSGLQCGDEPTLGPSKPGPSGMRLLADLHPAPTEGPGCAMNCHSSHAEMWHIAVSVEEPSKAL